MEFTKNILKFIFGIFEKLWNYIATEHLIYGWVLIILVVLSTSIIVSIFIKLKEPKQPRKLDYTDLYKKGHFQGVDWTWEYTNEEISDLQSFCPNCNIELVFAEITPKPWENTTSPQTKLICERCDVMRANLGGTKPFAYSAIKREIKRNIRNNEWR